MNFINKIKYRFSKENPNNSPAIMRYRESTLSFWLCILALIFDAIMFVKIYSLNSCIPNIELGIDVLINIVFMLACFLLAERNKAYDKKSAIFSIVIGALEILRVFWIPVKYHNQYVAAVAGGATGSGISGLNDKTFTLVIIYTVISGVFLILSGLVTYLRSKKLNSYLSTIKDKEDLK